MTVEPVDEYPQTFFRFLQSTETPREVSMPIRSTESTDMKKLFGTLKEEELEEILRQKINAVQTPTDTKPLKKSTRITDLNDSDISTPTSSKKLSSTGSRKTVSSSTKKIIIKKKVKKSPSKIKKAKEEEERAEVEMHTKEKINELKEQIAQNLSMFEKRHYELLQSFQKQKQINQKLEGLETNYLRPAVQQPVNTTFGKKTLAQILDKRIIALLKGADPDLEEKNKETPEMKEEMKQEVEQEVKQKFEQLTAQKQKELGQSLDIKITAMLQNAGATKPDSTDSQKKAQKELSQQLDAKLFEMLKFARTSDAKYHIPTPNFILEDEKEQKTEEQNINQELKLKKTHSIQKNSESTSEFKAPNTSKTDLKPKTQQNSNFQKKTSAQSSKRTTKENTEPIKTKQRKSDMKLRIHKLVTRLKNQLVEPEKSKQPIEIKTEDPVIQRQAVADQLDMMFKKIDTKVKKISDKNPQNDKQSPETEIKQPIKIKSEKTANKNSYLTISQKPGSGDSGPPIKLNVQKSESQKLEIQKNQLYDTSKLFVDHFNPAYIAQECQFMKEKKELEQNLNAAITSTSQNDLPHSTDLKEVKKKESLENINSKTSLKSIKSIKSGKLILIFQN